MLWHMKLKLREGFGCHWPSSPQFLSPTLSSETCQVFARKCLRSSFLIQTLEILHLLVDIVASAYLLGGKKFRLRSYKKLRHALLSRPTAPGPHIPPCWSWQICFSNGAFFLARLIKPPSLPSLLTSTRTSLLLVSPPGAATGQQRNWIQLKIEICFNWTSRFATNFFRDWGPFIENQLFANWL